MAVSYQLVIDCAAPETLARFWAEALHYVARPAAHRVRHAGTTSTGRSASPTRSSASVTTGSWTPAARVPRSGSRSSPRRSRSRTACTSTCTPAAAARPPIETRRERVEAEAERLVALGATRLRTIAEEGLDHYAVAMADPEGNEFDIN